MRRSLGPWRTAACCIGIDTGDILEEGVGGGGGGSGGVARKEEEVEKLVRDGEGGGEGTEWSV
jgi:hypothetical protein